MRIWIYAVCILFGMFAIAGGIAAHDGHNHEGDAVIIAQDALIELVAGRSEAEYEYFIKDKPIAIYRYDGEQELIPPAISANLGSVDQTEYTEEYLSNNSVIALQFNKDAPDFYVIDDKVFTEKYQTVKISDVKNKNGKLFDALAEYDGVAELITAKDKQLQGAIKLAPVRMIRVSAVYGRESIKTPLVIEAPWGGVQNKEARSDAYFVVGEGEVYIVNLGARGLPSGYVRKQ